jgi:hypothetical protein
VEEANVQTNVARIAVVIAVVAKTGATDCPGTH